MALQKSDIGYQDITDTNGESNVIPYTLDDLNTSDKIKANEVKAWLHGLTHPWSDKSVYISILPLTDEDEWVCDYCSVVYDGLESHVCEYGDTPQEALEKCIALRDALIERYNSMIQSKN